MPGTSQFERAKAGVGRPAEPVPQDIADEIVEWISEGKTLREFCRQSGKPSFVTVYAWQKKDASFAERIACARESGEDQIHQECLEIADNTHSGVTVTEKPYVFEGAAVKNPDGTPVIVTETKTGDMLEHRKLRIDTRLKLLAKWNPKKYGDRLDLNHGGEIGLNVLAERMSKARARK